MTFTPQIIEGWLEVFCPFFTIMLWIDPSVERTHRTRELTNPVNGTDKK